MPQLVVDDAQLNGSRFASRYGPVLRPITAAILVSVAYYIGAKIGFALTASLSSSTDQKERDQYRLDDHERDRTGYLPSILARECWWGFVGA